MSKGTEWGFRVKKMPGCIEEIKSSVSDHSSAESLYEDWESLRAIERNLQVIADARKGIPDNIRKEYADIEWQNIINMRNLVVHESAQVDEEIIWNTVQKDVPNLEAALNGIFKSLEGVKHD